MIKTARKKWIGYWGRFYFARPKRSAKPALLMKSFFFILKIRICAGAYGTWAIKWFTTQARKLSIITGVRARARLGINFLLIRRLGTIFFPGSDICGNGAGNNFSQP